MRNCKKSDSNVMLVPISLMKFALVMIYKMANGLLSPTLVNSILPFKYPQYAKNGKLTIIPSKMIL